MTAVQIALRSNPGRYTFSGNARLLNAYAEAQGNDAKAPYAVLPCPGMVLFSQTTDTPGRGLIFCEDLNCLYSIHSSGAFKVLSDGTATRIGTVPGVDQVQLSRNQADPAQISIHSASGEFYIQADVVKTVTDVDVTDEDVVTTENTKGYTLYGARSGKFIFSAINDCSDVDGLDFATAEQVADTLVRIKASGSDVFFFSVQSIEPWRVTSDTDLPFELIGGAALKKGMIAANGVVECDNTLMFPTEDNQFARIAGYNAQKISTHAQDRLLEGDSTRESVQGLSYSFQGHSFAGWTGSDWSVGFDAATNLWHDRQSCGLETWRARNIVRAWGRNIAQDSQTGNLYYLDGDTFTEGDAPMVWGVDTCFVNAFPGGGIVDVVHLDMQTGVGALLASADGYDPKVMLSWSVDGGKTFKGNRELSLGRRGQHTVRLFARRLGRFGPQGIQFRVRVSDPVIRGLIAMEAGIRPLKK